MARIAGVLIPKDKRIVISLTYIYGIGKTRSQKLLDQTKIDPNIRTKDLSDEQENALRKLIEQQHTVEGDLRREVSANIKRLRDIGSYRGTRHAKRLPARGQRTKTNNRTVRGNARRTMGSGRKDANQKT